MVTIQWSDFICSTDFRVFLIETILVECNGVIAYVCVVAI